MNFKKFIALICAFAFVFSNLINVSAFLVAEAVFLGDSGVGKSAVFRRLVPPVPPAARDDGAHGTITMEYSSIRCSNGDFLGLLDASCKEMYSSEIMTRCRDAKIAVICVDSTSRDSIENTDVYVKYVYDNFTNPEGVTFFWVATKIYAEGADDNLERIREKAGELGMVSCFVSAETGDGIENLRELLDNTATRVILGGAVIDRAVLDRRAAAVARAAANRAAAARARKVKAALLSAVVLPAGGAIGGAIVEWAARARVRLFKSRLPANQPQPQLA